MYVVGVAPGLLRLSYAALDLEPPLMTGYLLDSDVLHGSTNPESSLSRRAGVHGLILGVVIERYPPTVLAIAAEPLEHEPPEHLAATLHMIGEIAQIYGLPTMTLDRVEVQGLLQSKVKSFGRSIERRLGHPIGVQDRRHIAAIGVALAAAIKGVQTDENSVSRGTGKSQ